MRVLLEIITCLLLLSAVNTSVVYAQSELDRFKTEEEIKAERDALSWYELIIKDTTYYFNVVYKACADFYDENIASLAGVAKDANIFDKAEAVVKDRNVAAENRMKDIQEKTQLKGEVTDMQQVIDKKELHYEVKEFNDVKNEIQK